MKTRTMITLGVSSLLVAGTMVGAAGIAGFNPAQAGARSVTADARQAARHADAARKEIAKRKAAPAIAAAERAVAFAPQDGGYRALLGQAYMLGGRFASAEAALKDALTLDPGNGAAALNLALAQVALGQWMPARETLQLHEAHIPAADRGLAFALAGDPVTAVTLLTAAAREPGATARTRQNLALALALAGRWQDAKAVAVVDVPPAEVDQRIMQWAQFARPQRASDQVASLLGVTADGNDAGLPRSLALNATVPQLAVSVPADPIDAYMPGPAVPAQNATPAAAPVAAQQVAVVADLGMEVASAPVDLIAPAVAAPALGGVVFAPRREVVQSIPVRAAAPVRTAAVAASARVERPGAGVDAVPAATRAAPAAGNWFVQLGAYQSSGVARDAWARLQVRVSDLAAHSPSGMAFTTGGQQVYRLSVGGFARADAVRLCGAVKARGGNCFVRPKADDRIAAWAAGARVARR